MDADCRYVIVQRPGGIRGWNSVAHAFDSTCGYPGEGPLAPTRSKKEITSYFQKTERRTLPSQSKPATSNQNRIQLERLLPLDLESYTVTDSTPMPIDMNSDSRYWECDTCTLENNSLSLVCEGCGGNRADPDRVVCDGDNPDEAESEAKRTQRAYDQQKFVVDFNFGVSVVPGYQTFAIKDLDEYVLGGLLPTGPHLGTHTHSCSQSALRCDNHMHRGPRCALATHATGAKLCSDPHSLLDIVNVNAKM